MAKWVYFNNAFIEEEKALLHFRDLSFQRGYGVFDFFRLLEQTPLFLQEHLSRFYFSASEMHLRLAQSREELEAIITALIQRNDLPNTGIRLSLTGGFSEDGYTIAQPNLIISQHHFSPPDASQIQSGIKLFTYPHQRQLPAIKSIDYQMAIWLQPQRAALGADDILYHTNRMITESPRSNFFLITKEGKLITPAANILGGITRSKVIALASSSFIVEERDIHLDELKNAAEALLTSTTKQLLPIRQIDDVVLPSNQKTIQLLRDFKAAYMEKQGN